MSTEFATRAHFFEGQYLGAADLESLVGYFSGLVARHQLSSHTWGIHSGIELLHQTSPQGAVEVWLTPGVATDGYGRLLVVPTPTPVEAGRFAGQAPGLVPVWLRYRESAGQGVRPGFEVCGVTDAYARVIESFALEVGERRTIDTRQDGVTLDQDQYADARAAPGALLSGQPLAPDGAVAAQRFPVADDPGRWLIPVGLVLWQGGQVQLPTAGSARRSRLARRHSGWVGESLAGTGGLLRLGERLIPRVAGSTIEQVCAAHEPVEADLISCPGAALDPRFREPIWLDADTRARGQVRFYGSRAEWVDPAGTDYLSGGTLTAIQRQSPSPLTVGPPGVDLAVLLGRPQGTAGPTRLTIGAAVLGAAPDPCAPGFDYTPGVAIQHDGRLGIGSTSRALGAPLTIRAIEPNGAFIALEDGAGTLAWQLNQGPDHAGLNLTQTDPTASNLFIEAATGNLGVGTLTPSRPLHVIGEAHSGGSAGGFSFESRDAGGFIGSPPNGERWVWYADGGNARLWSNGDRLSVTPAGRVGIGTDTPAAALEVRGDVRLGNGGGFLALGAGVALAVVAGSVSAGGAPQGGSGFGAFPGGTGNYDVSFATGFGGPPTVVATVLGDDHNAIAVSSVTANGFHVAIRDVTPQDGNEGQAQSSAFGFVAVGPRP